MYERTAIVYSIRISYEPELAFLEYLNNDYDPLNLNFYDDSMQHFRNPQNMLA